MFATDKEAEFFFSKLLSEDRVLEFGCGSSTLEIARTVKEVVSMEHQSYWYGECMRDGIPDNCKVILKPPTLPYTEGVTCGNYEQFQEYVDEPISHGPFDVVLIDGRARVACAERCHLFAKKDARIFIHDFHRSEYKSCLYHLDVVDHSGSMFLFKLKSK